MVAALSFSSFSPILRGGLSRYWPQVFIVSSCSRRLIQYFGLSSRKELRKTCSASLAYLPPGASTAFWARAGAANATVSPKKRPNLKFIVVPLSALDARRFHHGAGRGLLQVGFQRDDRIGQVVRLRPARLAHAVDQAALHGPHGALRDAVGRPGLHREAGALLGRQVAEFLQADALAFLAVADRAGKILRARTAVEDVLAHLGHLGLFRVRRRHVALHAVRLA